jgi:hypothetical protein
MIAHSTIKRRPVHRGVFVALLQFSFLTSVLNIHALAAMAGFYQSRVEFEAIFNDFRLPESLNGHLMTSVSQDGHKILIKAENGCVIRGSIRNLPLPEGMMGARKFQISELKVEGGYTDNVISPRDGGPTSANRLQDFKNILTKLDGTYAAKFRMMNIDQIEMIGTDKFRISSRVHSVDIPFTPTI